MEEAGDQQMLARGVKRLQRRLLKKRGVRIPQEQLLHQLKEYTRTKRLAVSQFLTLPLKRQITLLRLIPPRSRRIERVFRRLGILREATGSDWSYGQSERIDTLLERINLLLANGGELVERFEAPASASSLLYSLLLELANLLVEELTDKASAARISEWRAKLLELASTREWGEELPEHAPALLESWWAEVSLLTTLASL